jgi:hypothetical protein
MCRGGTWKKEEVLERGKRRAVVDDRSLRRDEENEK